MQQNAVAKKWQGMKIEERKNTILKAQMEVLPEETPSWILNCSEEELARVGEFQKLPDELQSVLIAGLTKRGFSSDLCAKRLVLV